MKTIRITLTKDGAQAVCTLQYKVESGPLSITWLGNREAFKLTRGGLPDFTAFPIDSLPNVVAHQASQSAATFTIEDLDGEARTWEE
jgi:hypothetical protein